MSKDEFNHVYMFIANLPERMKKTALYEIQYLLTLRWDNDGIIEKDLNRLEDRLHELMDGPFLGWAKKDLQNLLSKLLAG